MLKSPFQCDDQDTYIHYIAGLVVPDVPLEETDILRSEASKNNLELVKPLSNTLMCVLTFYPCIHLSKKD
jgi:hypothetical protein